MTDLAADRRGALEHFLEVARDEVARVASSLDRERVAEAARCVCDAESRGGRVHVTGVGKPEHLARYAAALLSSTGTPATFLHGTEAAHGSVGQLRPGDVVIAISNSGETPELRACIEAVKGFDARVIAVTANPGSWLGRSADLVLEVGVEDEGGPLGFAPRASGLVQLMTLVALSVELETLRHFTAKDYARRHPSGVLGRRADAAQRRDPNR